MKPIETIHVQTYGFDIFIGKAIYSDGRVYLTTTNLKSYGGSNYNSLYTASRELFEEVKKEKKILLSKSAGYFDSYKIKLGELMERLLSIINKTRYSKRLVINDEGKGYITMSGYKLKPFNNKEMKKLEEMYHSIPESEEYPDPFLYQP